MLTYEGSLFLDVAEQRLLDLHRAHANDRLAHLARATASERLNQIADAARQEHGADPVVPAVRPPAHRSLFDRFSRGRAPRPAA